LEAEREEDVENILERCYSVGIEENHVRQNPPLDSPWFTAAHPSKLLRPHDHTPKHPWNFNL
jgi:hypothetical protein